MWDSISGLARHPEDGLARHPEARSAERIALNPRQFQLPGRDSDPFVAARLRMTSGASTQDDTPASLRFLRSRAASLLSHQDGCRDSRGMLVAANSLTNGDATRIATDARDIATNVISKEKRMATDKGYHQREENPHQGFGATGANPTEARAETKSSRSDQERSVQTGREQARPAGVSRRSPTTPAYGYGSGALSPFSLMRRMAEDMDRMFDNFSLGRNTLSAPAFGTDRDS